MWTMLWAVGFTGKVLTISDNLASHFYQEENVVPWF